MEQVAELVLAELPNPGDKKLYAEVYAAIPAELRPHMRKALQILKADGRVRQEVVFEDGVNTHSLIRF